MTSSYPGDEPPQPQGGYAPAPPAYGGYPQRQTNGIATAGLVCGIIGLVLFWFPIVGMVLAVLGVIFGGIGLSKANKGAPNKGLAIAGLVCGAVAILLYVAIILIVVNNN